MLLAPYLEYNLLKATTTIEDVIQLCANAEKDGIAAVCVPPLFVRKAKELLEKTGVKVATVIGYPLGYSAIEAKLAEILLTVVDGADELNVVINYMAVKNNDWAYIANEINHILPVVKGKGKVIKAVLETSVLTQDELKKCLHIYGAAGVDFIDTATGHFPAAIEVDVIKFIRSNLATSIHLKVTTTSEPGEAETLIAAGVARMGRTYLNV